MSEFKIYSGLLKAHRSPDGKMRLHGVASSSIMDLHGDTMQLTALQDMEHAANQNLTIFLNHSYDVPEDVGGSVEFARLINREAFYDLDMDIVVNDANPRAVQTFEAIERGTKLGISIGAFIPEGGARKDKNGAYLIDHVDLKEASVVGIPANPRSWVEYAVKSLKDVAVAPVEEEDDEIVEEGDLDFDPVPVDLPVTEEVEEVEKAAKKDTDSDAGAPASQEASASAPENEDGLLDEDADGTNALLGDTVTRQIAPQLVDMLEKAVRELASTKQQLSDALAGKAAAEQKADRATAEREMVLRQTKILIDRIADTPLVRRAVVREVETDFRTRFSAIYGDDFIKMLENHE